MPPLLILFFFVFNDPATTAIYTLSLHDALPICPVASARRPLRHPSRAHERGLHALRARLQPRGHRAEDRAARRLSRPRAPRSEEHTSELQSQSNLVCRLLLEKKKKIQHPIHTIK